jgi:hypothetical protein
MKQVFFFRPFPLVNPSVRIFFYYQRTKNYWRKIHRRSISVCDSIGKLIINEMILQIPIKNSINKYKDCDSAYWWSPSWNFDIVVGFVSLLLHCCFLTSMSIRTGEQKHYYYYFFLSILSSQVLYIILLYKILNRKKRF